MKKPSDPLILAALNVLLVTILAATDFFHLELPYGYVALPLVIVLVLLTLILALRDMLRKRNRNQAFVALGLVAPIFYLYFLRRW